jgi:glycosyltransferase involved in cell wall biosynthesis
VIYVCIPCHDEAATLGPLLWKVSRVMRDFGREFQLVVLDDGSSDDTAEVLARYDEILPLTVLTRDERSGYGAAVDRLLRHTVEVTDYPKRDAAVLLQGDLTEDPENLVDLVKLLEGGADIVAGRTPDPSPQTPSPVRWGRRLAPWVMGGALRDAPVADPLCGLRAYRIIVLKKAIRELDEPLASAPESWVANLELLQRVVGFARRVEEVQVAMRDHLRVRPSRFRTIQTLRSLFRHRSRAWASPAEDDGGNREVAA